jgi:hypothetical protein
MSAKRASDIATPDFSTATTRADGALHVRCIGNAHLEAAAVFQAFMTALHQEAMEAGATTVVLDLRELEFMSSSCFKALVALVVAVGALPAGQRYAVRFRQAAEYHWQRRSLHALESLAVGVVSIEG